MDSKIIQYIIAQPRKFQFGSNMYWELCNRIKRDELCDMNTNVLSKLFS